MTTLMQVAYSAQRRLWKLFRPNTRGVKVILFNSAREILLIRNSYGASDLFVLPGGGVRPWERPIAAARREVFEELGCAIEELAPVSTHFTSAEGKRDTIHLFEATLAAVPKIDGTEVIEARFFPLDKLPDNISPATVRRLAERNGQRAADGTW
ncbi:MAG TPA: NUDIX domain-containing protein [Sphingomicrobium sp.]|nr:NUDIX domain-containing protein [Sphingomicrobium sp.]